MRKNPFPFHNIILPNDSLDLQKKSTKDNWISKVLYEDIYGEDENWMDFEDEEV